MANYLIDTNVLIAASRLTDVGDLALHEIHQVRAWFANWGASSDGFVFHKAFLEEYKNKLNFQDYGLMMIQDKMTRGQIDWCLDIEFDENGHAIVPDAFAKMDQSDKKWVAAALQNPDARPIVNCADSDWEDESFVLILNSHNIQVIALRRKSPEKQIRKGT